MEINMKMNKMKLASAIALVLASSSASALTATWDADGAGTAITADAVAVQNTAAALEAVTPSSAFANLAATASVVGLQVGDTIKVTISGATFNRTNVATAADALITEAAVDTAADTASAGGTMWSADASAVPVWTLDSTNTMLTTSAISFASATNTDVNLEVAGAGIIDLTGVAKGAKITYSIEVLRDLVGIPTVVHSSSASASLIDIDDLFTVVATKTTDVITVASGFTDLESGTNTVNDIDSGTLTVTENDGTATSITGTSQVVLAGDMSGVTSISNAAWTVGGGGASVPCDSAGVTKTVTAGEYYIDTAANKAFMCIDATGTVALDGDVIDPNYVFDGASALATRSYTAAINYSSAGSADFSSMAVPANIVTTLTRDGSAFSVNSAGGLNTIKITDMSGSISSGTGSISVTAFDEAGLSVTGSLALPSLTANSTEVISMENVVAAFPGAVRFDFVVESTQIVASNVKKSDQGTTVTVYRNAVDSDGVTAANGAL